MTANTKISKISRARYLAREALHKCGLSHPTQLSVEEIAYALGVHGVQSIPLYGAEGRIMASNGKYLISYSEAIKHEGKRRFVIAHELGHFCLHRPMLDEKLVHTDRSRSFKDTVGQEAEANAFASELLMPASLLYDQHFLCIPTMEAFEGIAEDFQVSLMTLLMRYCEIGQVPTCLIVSKNGHVKWSKASSEFPWPFVKPGFKVDRTTLAAAFHSGYTPSVSRKEVKGSCWFGVGCDYEIMEQSYLFGRDGVVTLVW